MKSISTQQNKLSNADFVSPRYDLTKQLSIIPNKFICPSNP